MIGRGDPVFLTDCIGRSASDSRSQLSNAAILAQKVVQLTGLDRSLILFQENIGERESCGKHSHLRA